MKKWIMSFGCFCLSVTAVQAQSGVPAASPLKPAASIGLPMDAEDGPTIHITQHTEAIPKAPATLANPLTDMTAPPPMLDDVPKTAPDSTQPAFIGQNAYTPNTVGPLPTSGQPPISDYDPTNFNSYWDDTPAYLAPNRFVASAEYLMWWTRGFSVPSLLTTAPPE